MPGRRVASREQAEPPQVHPSTYAARVAGQTAGRRGRRRAPLGAAARPVDLGRLRRPCRAQWRGLGRLLVHGVPPRGAAPGTRSPPGREAGAGRVGGAHAALVYAGDDCVGWCQFGPPAELPRIKHRRAYEQGAGADPSAPDSRITCSSSTRPPGVAGSRRRRSTGPSTSCPASAAASSRASRGRRGAEGLLVVPAQRHPGALREPGLRTGPPAGQEPLAGAPHRARPGPLRPSDPGRLSPPRPGGSRPRRRAPRCCGRRPR